jgi:hypothetical protein
MGRLLVWTLFGCALAGCPTQKPPVTVTVRTPDTQPVAGAVVGWLCTPQGDGAAVSDASGAATVVIFNSEPKTCTVTVAKIGFRTQQITNQPLGPLDVTLEPSP